MGCFEISPSSLVALVIEIIQWTLCCFLSKAFVRYVMDPGRPVARKWLLAGSTLAWMVVKMFFAEWLRGRLSNKTPPPSD
jgi:hypothetical protein